jgi:hypothetical protein
LGKKARSYLIDFSALIDRPTVSADKMADDEALEAMMDGVEMDKETYEARMGAVDDDEIAEAFAQLSEQIPDASDEDKAGAFGIMTIMFAKFDADGSGYLSPEEMVRGMADMNGDEVKELPPAEEIDAAMAQIDINGDGQISIAEFCRVMAEMNTD